MAFRYYSILSSINGLNLTNRELQIIAFIADRGTISSAVNKREFSEKYNSSPATINNMVSKLKKIGVLVKSEGKVKVNPSILLDFDKNLTIVIKVENNGQTNRNVSEGVYNEEDVSQN